MTTPSARIRRCFIAYALPAEIHKYCAHAQATLRKAGSRGRFVAPGNFHVTIHFLGDITTGRLREIRELATPIQDKVGSVLFSPKTLGSFGRPPRVLFIDMEDDGGKGAAIVEELRRLTGLPTEEGRNEWRAHITLARFRSRGEADSWDGRTELPDPPPAFHPAGIGFYTSELTEKGPKYSMEFSIDSQ